MGYEIPPLPYEPEHRIWYSTLGLRSGPPPRPSWRKRTWLAIRLRLAEWIYPEMYDEMYD